MRKFQSFMFGFMLAVALSAAYTGAVVRAASYWITPVGTVNHVGLMLPIVCPTSTQPSVPPTLPLTPIQYTRTPPPTADNRTPTPTRAGGMG